MANAETASGSIRDVVKHMRVVEEPPSDIRRERLARAQEWMRSAQVPVETIRSFSSFESRAVCSVASQWAAEHVARRRTRREIGRLILCLAGPSGVGKSVAAALIVGRCGYAIWLHAHDMQALNPVDRDRWADVSRCPLLVIDDLGVERMTDNVGSVLDALITRRFDAGKGTVITTNLRADQIRARYGDRIARRIEDCGGAYEVTP